MTFAAPEWLWALLLVPLFALAAVRHARALRREESSGDGARWLWVDGARLRSANRAGAARSFGAWAGMGLALGVVALAQPQWGEGEIVRFDQGREVLIALDLSRSMLANDVPPTRLGRARLLIESTLDELRGERVGLLLFAGTAFLQSPLSADHEVLRELLPVLEPGYLPQGGTDFAAMIAAALEAFSQTGAADRYLVILSDGESPNFEASAVDALVEAGVRVVALGVGTAEGALIPDGSGGIVKDERGAAVLSRLERPVLEGLAEATNGVYADAARWVDLASLVERTVAEGQEGQFIEERERSKIHRFQWWLAPALLLLLASHLREMPSAPKGRRLHEVDRASTRAPSAARAARAAVAVLAAALGIVGANAVEAAQPPSPAAGAAAPAEAAPVDPLVEMVDAMAAAPQLGALDYAAFARTTAEAGFDRRDAGAPLPPGVVGDALAAVAVGRALDPDAAAWDDLQQALEVLHQPPPPSDSQQESKQQQGGESGEGESGEEQEGESQQSQSSESGASEEGDDAEGSESQPGEQGEDSGGASDADADGEQGEPNEGDPSAGTEGDPDAAEDEGSAGGERPEGDPQALADAAAGFGDLDETEADAEDTAGAAAEAPPEDGAQDTESEAEPAPPSRMVGGAPSENDELIQARPDLASAIGRMERVRDGDAPALLFDRMNRAEGQTEQRDGAGGQDW